MTPPFTSPPAVPADGDLNIAVLERLYALPFDAFTRCVGLLLARMGYTNVKPVGRGHYRGSNGHRKIDPRGVSCSGTGYDLVADLPTPEGSNIRRFAVASLKQFPPDAATAPVRNRARVFQRQVDEVRGTSLRAGASVALLITTGSISPTVTHRETLPLAPIAPVCVIDGEELARLCVRFGVGVTPAEDGRAAETGEVTLPVLDALFFERLARAATGNGPTDFAATTQGGDARRDGFPLPKRDVSPLPKRDALLLSKRDSMTVPRLRLSVRVSVTDTGGGGDQ